MSLYLVRWPGLQASIVQANDEEHLAEIIDEVASPSEVTWAEYKGPLWFDVSLGVDAEPSKDGWQISLDEETTELPWLAAQLLPGDSETGEEMIGSILAGAFPHLTRVLQDSEDDAPDPAKIEQAAAKDLADHEPSRKLPELLRHDRTDNGTNQSS